MGRIGKGVGRRKSRLPEVIVLLGNSVRPGTEFLIGAARPHLSIVCQLLVKFFRFVRERNTANSVEIGGVSFDSFSRNLFSFYVNLECLANYERGKKTQFLHWYCLWEKRNNSDAGTHQTNNDGETFERVCRVNLPVN